ncbi:hypothetical protein QAD02_015090 [Eretmocerus hayati]|uniref:Uncharacterized protein n=1 Tax=Eretmocerus hayati TaxID=131215 RepID=A0ACC2P891_9HYME|nr:hypothetical protein QAD02_015090 [Eretmocerus hayati]
MSSMKEELLVKWGGINSLYREEESLVQDIRSHLQEVNTIARTVNNTPKGVRAELGNLNPNGATKGKYSPPSENDKEKGRLKRKDLRPPTPSFRKDSVSGNVATDSEMEWKTQRRRARPKKKKKSKRKAEWIRIRPDAIVVRQKAENATYAETLELMKPKVDEAFAGGKFNKVRQTKSGEVLIGLQKGAKVTEVRETIASSLGEGVVVRELQQTVAVDIRDIDLDTTSAEIAKAIRDALPDGGNEEITVEALRPAYRRTQMAVVVLPVAAVKPLLQYEWFPINCDFVFSARELPDSMVLFDFRGFSIMV